MGEQGDIRHNPKSAGDELGGWTPIRVSRWPLRRQTRKPRRDRKLTDEQVAFARLCTQMRERYPSRDELAKAWGVSKASIRRAALGIEHKHVPWREGVL